MSLSAFAKKLLNNLTPGAKQAKLGDLVAQATATATATTAGQVKQGVHVPDAAGSAPTKAEFDALLASLRTAGVIASA